MRFCLAATVAAVAALLAAAIHRGNPSFEHLPEGLRPHRPLAIQLINGLGGPLADRGLLLPSEGSLTSAACKAAALPHNRACKLDNHVTPPTWRRGLQKLLKAYKEEARLTALGNLIARGHLEQWLATRMRLMQAYERIGIGRINNETIERPIFIVGWARTGTTFLHNLLAKDESMRAPMHWELMSPVAEGNKAMQEGDIDAIQSKLDQFMQLVPGACRSRPSCAVVVKAGETPYQT